MRQYLVKLAVPLGEEILQLSTLDQQAQRNYADFVLIFRSAEDGRTDQVLHHMRRGLELALCEFPDFASTVTPCSSRCHRKELELRLGPESGVQVMETFHAGSIDDDIGGPSASAKPWSYRNLSKGHFPLADVPRQELFGPRPCGDDEAMPALIARINIIQGGMILGISWHHSVSDARGISTLLGSWARHTSAIALEGAVGNPVLPDMQAQERWRLLYGHSHADVDISQFPEYAIDASVRASSRHVLDGQQGHTFTKGTFSTWYCSAAALQSLQSSLNNTAAREKREGSVRLTQGEALSALVWKHVSSARLLHRIAPGGSSLFSTRIDFRSRMSPPFQDAFVGNINEPNAQARLPLGEVCAPSTPESLARLGRIISDAIMNLDEKAVRSFIDLVHDLSAVPDLVSKSTPFPGPDLAISDMSGLDTLQQDWGSALGHHPICMRSGSRENGLVYFLPRDRDGGFEMHLQCEVDALERLKADDIFTNYASFRC